MSKFSTVIPVNVDSVINSLPKKSLINEVRIGEDLKSIVIDWEQDEWRTPYTVPIEVKPEQLTGKEPLPETIKCKRVQNDEVATPPARKAKVKQ